MFGPRQLYPAATCNAAAAVAATVVFAGVRKATLRLHAREDEVWSPQCR